MKKTKLIIAFILCVVIAVIFSAAGTAINGNYHNFPTVELPEGSYTYTVTDGEVYIHDADVKGKITVPVELAGYPVTEIGYRAFGHENELISVTIPGSIKVIGKEAFSECINLEEVIIEEGVEEIGEEAFATYWFDSDIDFDSNLRSVTLPDSVKIIRKNAFAKAKIDGRFRLPEGLTLLECYAFSLSDIDELYIPENMEYSEDIVLSGYEDKIRIVVDENSSYYCADEKGNIYAADMTAMFKYTPAVSETEFTVPEGIEYIADFCFANQQTLEKVTMPDSVTKLGESAFMYSPALKQVRLSENLAAIPQYAFGYDKNLAVVNIPLGLTEIGMLAFYDCAIPGEIVFGESLKKIGRSAFMLNDITKVTFLGDDITLDEQALCKNKLTEVIFGKGNIILDKFSLSGNEELKKLSFTGGNVSLGKYVFRSTGIETLEINCDTGEISPEIYTEDELYNVPPTVNNITKLVIGKDAKNIDKLLYLPASLKEIVVHEDNPYYTAKDNALYNKDMTVLLRVLPNVSGYTFPESVREIGEMAFQGNRSLSEINIPEGVEIIGERAFYKSAVKRLDIPQSMKRIGERAFGWSSLESVVIHGRDIEHINDYMFRGCKKFEDFYYAGTKAEYKQISDSKKGNRLWSVDKHFEATPENHPYKETVKTAGINKNGEINLVCPCGEKKKYTIAAVEKIEANLRNGQVVTSVLAGKKKSQHSLTEGKDYKQTVSYDKNKNIIKVKVTLTGYYKGSKTLSISGKLSAKTISAVAKADCINLQWTAPAGATGYKLYKYDSQKAKWVQIKSADDYDVEPGKTYKYRIRFYSKVQTLGVTLWSDYSNITVKTPKATLATPVITKTEYDGGYKVKIYWQAVEGAQGYTVFCSETPTGGYEKALSCGGDATQATVRVDPDSEKPNVYFKVRAYSKDTGSKNVVYRSECSAEPGVIVMWTEEN